MKQIFASLLLTTALGTGMTHAQTAPALKIGDAAPALRVKQWLKGKPLASFEKGKVYVVECWATWCLPCIAGMPHLSELAEKYKNKVTVIGVSIMERKTTTLERIQRFVDSNSQNMRYEVAAEDSNYMATNWLYASGERGIPFAFIVDQQGRIAWMGHPKLLDKALPGIVAGKADINAAGNARIEHQRLTKLDGNEVVLALNPYMGNPGKPDSALIVIGQFVAKDPALKYYSKIGHFTIWSLIKTDQPKMVAYTRELFVNNEEPPFKSVTDAVGNMSEIRKATLLPEVYAVGADAYQEQIDRYPWSMDMPVTYSKIAEWQMKAGNKQKAIDAQQKAIEFAKKKEGFPAEQLSKLEDGLKLYKSL